jgi:Outer membrane lipoprotein carrier protein LolA-like
LRTSLAQAPVPDAAALIERLARPAPASIAFTEVRFSPLLKAPLIVSGQLGYQGASRLDRRVLRPYLEDTSIRGEAVRVEREGAAPRSFALRRAPELRGLLESFTALLAGDAAALERNFAATTLGRTDDWRLELTPRDPKMQRRVERIVVSGAHDAPRCFIMHGADGGASVMLLGEAAEQDVAGLNRMQVLAQCGVAAPA